jgi:hypothetical protein
VAWNDVPAKDDDALSFQAYYVRLNALRQFLPPLSSQLFEIAWDQMASQKMLEFRRSALAGIVIADLIRALGLDEVTAVDTPVGSWFVHSGVTTYRHQDDGEQMASIDMGDGHVLESVVRPDCRVTSSAAVNMQGEDDVSLVVGRRTSDDRFDLIAAGYRDPIAHLKRATTRGTRSDLHILDRQWTSTAALPRLLPNVRFEQPDELNLAFAVKDTVDRFALAVQKQGAWKLLHDSNGEPAHETRHQGMFRLFSQLSFGALGIMIHPNADHGRGATDMTLTLHDAVHIVEFKKDSSPAKLLHGLQHQLPHYMSAAGTLFGSYLVMCHEREPEQVTEILDGTVKGSDLAISVYSIDCRPQPSASKA